MTRQTTPSPSPPSLRVRANGPTSGKRPALWRSPRPPADLNLRAELLRFALDSARSEGLESSAARLWRPQARSLPAIPALAAHGEPLARTLLLAGDGPAAAPWLALLQAGEDEGSRAALLRLAPQAALLGALPEGALETGSPAP